MATNACQALYDQWQAETDPQRKAELEADYKAQCDPSGAPPSGGSGTNNPPPDPKP